MNSLPCLFLRKDLSGRRDHTLSKGCRPHGPATFSSFEQGLSEVTFQAGDLRGQCGLGGAEGFEYVVIDEANRLLEKGSSFRAEAARLIKEIGRTGRSVGIGIVLAAQAGHLDELGGSDTLRAMLKEGEVILLRWSSQMMAALVGDGLVPSGEILQPIPKILGCTRRIQTWGTPIDRSAEKPNSQGMCYHLTSARPTSMVRFFLVGSLAPHDGYDPEIRKLYGASTPPGKPLTLIFPPSKEGDADPGNDHEYDAEDEPDLEAMPETPKTNADRILDALADGPCPSRTFSRPSKKTAGRKSGAVLSAPRSATCGATGRSPRRTRPG